MSYYNLFQFFDEEKNQTCSVFDKTSDRHCPIILHYELYIQTKAELKGFTRSKRIIKKRFQQFSKHCRSKFCKNGGNVKYFESGGFPAAKIGENKITFAFNIPHSPKENHIYFVLISEGALL